MPADVVASGTTATSPCTRASACASYAGASAAAAPLGSGYLLLVGGSKTTGGVPTLATFPTMFKVTSVTSTPEQDQYAYEWRRPQTVVTGHGNRPAASSLTDIGHQGYVLVTGGADLTATTSNTATLFRHEETGLAWYAAASMAAARFLHQQVTLTDGRVLVTGGCTTNPTPISACEIWDPTTETWSAAASMSAPRSDHVQVLLADGKVLVAGGTTASSGVAFTAEVYDPDTDTWTPTGHMAMCRTRASGLLLPDGRVLVVGGEGLPAGGLSGALGSAVPLASAEIWDPVTGRWSPAGTMSAPRSQPAIGIIPSLGAVMVAGGETTDLDLLVLATGRWRRSIATLSTIRRNPIGYVLPEGGMLLAGGDGGASVLYDTSEISHIVVPGAEQVASSGANAMCRVVSVASPTVLSVEVPEGVATFAEDVGGVMTRVRADSGAQKGPFLMDRDAVVLTGVTAEVATPLAADRSSSTLVLDSTEDFPDEEGWLVINFGRYNQIGPIRYLGVLSETDLRLDASFVLPMAVAAGDVVTLLSARAGFSPDPTVGLTWITASPSGRVAASALLDDVAAAGIPLVKRVVYPGDRGLGAEGSPTTGASRLSGIVTVYAGDDPDGELTEAREDT